jgi:hypothetical protein
MSPLLVRDLNEEKKSLVRISSLAGFFLAVWAVWEKFARDWTSSSLIVEYFHFGGEERRWVVLA